MDGETLAAVISGEQGAGGEGDGSANAGNPSGLNDAFGGAKTGETGKEAGAAGGGTGAGSEAQGKLAPWAEQLPPELKGNAAAQATLAKFKKLGDLAGSYLELEKKLSSGTVGIPGKDATPEEVASFWQKAGKPKT
jgi:hypothetical protein